MNARVLQRALGLAALGAALLFADEAHVSQVHYMDEPLESVIGQVELVVVGALADPPTRSETLRFPITRADGTKGEGEYGVYVHRVKAVEVLYPAGAALPKGVMEIYTPELLSGLDTSLAYEVDGIMESPIYMQLAGGIYPAAPEHAAGAIYLLRQPQAYATPQTHSGAYAALYGALSGAYPMVIGGAALPLEQREAVLAALKARGKALTAEPG